MSATIRPSCNIWVWEKKIEYFFLRT